MNALRHRIARVGFAISVALSGCCSLEEHLARQEQQVLSGSVAAAYTEAASAAADENVDTTFWQAEAGALALMHGKTSDALAHLDAADNGFNDVARRYYGASLFDTLKAVTVNDTQLPYAPEGLDRVFANLYKAFAYGATGSPDAMRVELNRARQRQQEWFYLCSKAIAESNDAAIAQQQRIATREAAQSVGTAKPLDADVARAITQGSARAEKLFGRLRGFGNAYAAHVAGVVRWCAGDTSLNDLAMAAALAPQNAYAQADAASIQQGGRPAKRVWIYVEDGLAPKRVARPITVPYPSIAGRFNGIGTLSFNVPQLRPRSSAAQGYAINGVALQPLQAVDALAQDQFRRAYPAILMRQIARTALRVATQETGHAVLRNSGNDPLLLFLYDLTMVLFDTSTNDADLRCADLLPKTIWMAALDNPQSGILKLTPDTGSALTIPLPTQGNALVWVRRPTAGSRATVITIPLDEQKGVSR